MAILIVLLALLGSTNVQTSSSPGPGPRADGAACSRVGASPSDVPGACWRPYGESSPFNTPVGSEPAVASNSAQIVDRITGFSPTPYPNQVGNADTSIDWSHPIYFSKSTDPLFRLHFEYRGDRVTWGTSPEIEGMQIRIPDAARPAGGSDAHMSVIDQENGWEYGFYDVQEKPDGGGTLVATSGGRARLDGDGLTVDATAAYFPPAAGMIRLAELNSGEIDHALFMVVQCTNGKVYPADPVGGAGGECSDLGLSDTNAPALGQHLYLDMTEAEINALSAPRWRKAILRAMAEYGMYIGDTGGSGWGLMFESGSSYTSFGHQDPWIDLAEKLGVSAWDDPGSDRTLYAFRLGDVVGWRSKLRVVEPAS